MLTQVWITINEFETENPKYIDAEAFYRSILITRSIAVSRPQNLFYYEPSEPGN